MYLKLEQQTFKRYTMESLLINALQPFLPTLNNIEIEYFSQRDRAIYGVCVCVYVMRMLCK